MNVRVPPRCWPVAGTGAQEARPKMELSFSKSIEIALAPDGNTKVQLPGKRFGRQARKAEARSALLPNVDAAWHRPELHDGPGHDGLQISLPPGFHIPTFVGTDQHLRSASDGHADGIRPKHHPPAAIEWSAGCGGQARLRAVAVQAAALAGKAYMNAARAETAVETALANVNWPISC